MKTITILFSLLGAALALTAGAQTTKPFSAAYPADNGAVEVGGDKAILIPFSWTSGKGPQPTNVNYDYQIMFFAVGDTNTPLGSITKSCCASSFADTVLNFNGEKWADFLNPISRQVYGRDMVAGDSMDLLWRVTLTATGPGPNYVFRPSVPDFTVRFVRGQFEDEFVPVQFKTPVNADHFFIQGDPNQVVPFSWTSAYCPTGCGPATYELLIDTVNGDWEYPYLSITVPNNDSAWSVSYNTLNQLLTDTKTPHGSSRQVFWKLLIQGDNEVVYSHKTGQITLWNGLLNNEHKPFNLVNPTNNFIIHLTGQASTQLNFKWESTYTPLASPEFYYVVFDTIGATIPFNTPLLQFPTPVGGMDTALNLAYGKIDRSLDSLYPGWTEANLIWSVKASINTSYYYPTATHNIQFKSGLMIGLEDLQPALNIYPNPAKDHVYVPGADHAREIRIFNVQGQLVLTKSLLPGEGKISCSELPEGLYLLYLRDGETTSCEKVLISR